VRAVGDAGSPLLDVRDLTIRFGRSRPVVNGISFTVDHGETVALVGESGSGKSMTARAVLDLLPRSAHAGGSIRVRGREVLGASDAELNSVRGAAVAMVFQEPDTALNPVRTVGWQLGEALRAHRRVSRPEARARATELLAQVEIADPELRIDYYPHQLSGGQKQRVALALALANEPALVLADEPTTALDVTVQAEILALLRRLNAATGTSILLITHNMGVVAEMADRVIVLQAGDVVEQAGTGRIFAAPRHAYTRRLLGAMPRLSTGGGGPAATDRGDSADPGVLRFEHATVTYPARRGHAAFTAVEDVSLAVGAGEILGLVGGSGSGKTTLGRVAAGLVPLSSGRVLVDGCDLAEASARDMRELRRGLAFVHQDPAASLDPLRTVADSIREPLDVHRAGDRAARDARVAELLDAVRLPRDFAHRLPRELSGGQRQRVVLARSLALRPRLVIADEPTSALDVSVQADVLALLLALQRAQGFACIFISHDLAVVQQVADRVAVLRAGELVECGPAAQVLARPAHPYTRKLLAAVPDPTPRSGREAASAAASAI
jgi:peptide/nickel transport system ATP-binding protein